MLIHELETTQLRVDLMDTRCGCIFSFGFISGLGGVGGGRVCRVPVKEWMSRAPMRPALAVFPRCEAVTPFPEAVALSG